MRLLIGFIFILFSLNSISAIDHWETVVYETDTWRYLLPSSAVSPTWNTLAFSDASWSTGQGGFGYGDGDDNTTFPAIASCYQRITFNITDVSAIESAIFHIDYDDAFVAYLNGVEIGRSNITSAGQPAFSQLSDGNHEAVMYSGGLPSAFVIDAAFLSANMVTGSNVLCIQTHNQSAGSSDMSSRAFLSLGINNTSSDYGVTPVWFVAPIIFSSSNLPIVVINTAGGAGIPDDPKIDATMGIIYNGPGVVNNLTDPFNEFDGDIGIERRGSSSGGFPKNQWGLETRDPSGVKVDVSIFNMAYDNDWVLYAPYSDKSLLRNVISYKMGWDTERYAPRTKLCEVMLNGSYEGVYVFTEKIKRKDGKVGNNDLEPEDISGNEITGDYILKVDKTTAGGSAIWTSPFPPYLGAPGLLDIQAHDPDLDSLVPVQRTYIEDVFTAFETALAGSNFSDPVLGFAPYVDMGSYIDFMLVNEFGKNVDGYRISTFFHKKRLSDGGEFVAGPLWDFNLAWGNANYCDGGNTTGWEIDFYTFCGGGGLQNPFWFERLVQDPAFSHDMNCRWQEMRQGAWHTDTLMAYVDSMASYLEEAQQRNFQKWQVLGTYLWPNNFIGNTYAEEVGYLKTWITDRATWMDANMFGTCNDLGVLQEENDYYRIFPNPADDFVTIEFPYLVIEAEIVLYDPSGKIVLEKTINQTYDVQLALGELATGIYHYRIIEPNKRTSTGKLNVH